MECRPYKDSYAVEWDDFVINKSLNGTFLHTRKFISYHEDKFVDRSFMIFDEKNKLIAVFPAAESLLNKSEVISHPGITYGGIVAGDSCRGETCVNVLFQLCEEFRLLGYEKLIYKVVPDFYKRSLYQDDSYAIFRKGGERYRCDLSATISLLNRGKLTKGRKYEINKAKKRSLVVSRGAENSQEIYQILVDNLSREHGASPVHSYLEIKTLSERFPNNIEFIAVSILGNVVAGLVLFYCGKTVHTQYIASKPEAHEVGALDYLIEEAIIYAKDKGYELFDFGISNEQNGRILNSNLYRYKRSFGAGSTLHEFYAIDLGVS